MGSVFDRPKIDSRDFDRVGTGAGRTASSLPFSGSVGAAEGVALASSTLLTPSRISSEEAPWGAVVVNVSVARILSAEAS
jgi:hypothetical protein